MSNVNFKNLSNNFNLALETFASDKKITKKEMQSLKEVSKSKDDKVIIELFDENETVDFVTSKSDQEVIYKLDISLNETNFKSVVTVHDKKYESLFSKAKDLHTEAQEIINRPKLVNGKNKSLKGLRKIDNVNANYKNLFKKINKEFLEIVENINEIDKQIELEPNNKDLKPLKELLEIRKEKLLTLKANASLAQSSDASGFSKESNFPGYRSSVKRVQRKNFIDSAFDNLSMTEKVLRVNINHLDNKISPEDNNLELSLSRINVLKNKLIQINEVKGMLGKDNLEFEIGLTLADQFAYKREETLNELIGNLSSFKDKNNLSDHVDLALNNNPEISKIGLDNLNLIRNSLIKIVQASKEKYSNYTPTLASLNIIDLQIKKLETYDFTNTDKIKSFSEQVKNINSEISETLEDLNNSLTRKSEINSLKGVNKSIDSYFEKVDLQERKINSFKSSFLGQISSEIEHSINDINKLVDYKLENPSFPDEAFKNRKELLVSNVNNKISTYKSWVRNQLRGSGYNQSEINQKLTESPNIKLLKKIKEKASLLSINSSVNYSEINKDINDLLKNSEISGIDKISFKRSASSLNILENLTNLEKRIKGNFPNELSAVNYAKEIASKDPSKSFGVVHQGWENGKHNGFNVVDYPIQFFDNKLNQSLSDSSNLVFVASKTKNGGKSSHELLNKSNFNGKIINKNILENESSQDKLLKNIGTKSKEIALKQYDSTINLYKSFEENDQLLLDSLLKIGENGNLDADLKNLFGLNPYLTQGGAKSSPIVGSKIRQIIKTKNHGNKKEAQKLLNEFKKSEQFQAVKEGLSERLDILREANSDIKSLDDIEAGFSLTKQYPAIREEVYRHFGFKIDPAKGVPPESDGDVVDEMIEKSDFSSTAEMVFVTRAEDWGDWETTKSIGKTVAIVGGIVGLGLLTGGLGTAAGLATVVGTTGAVAGYQVYEAGELVDRSKADFSAQLVGENQLVQAELTETLTKISAVIQLATAGVSVGLARVVNPQTLTKAVALDVGIGTSSTLIDPLTYQGDSRQILANIAVGGVVSYASTKASIVIANKGSKLDIGDNAKVYFDRNNKPFLKSKNGEMVELRAKEIENETITFGIAGSNDYFKLKIDSAFEMPKNINNESLDLAPKVNLEGVEKSINLTQNIDKFDQIMGKVGKNASLIERFSGKELKNSLEVLTNPELKNLATNEQKVMMLKTLAYKFSSTQKKDPKLLDDMFKAVDNVIDDFVSTGNQKELIDLLFGEVNRTGNIISSLGDWGARKISSNPRLLAMATPENKSELINFLNLGYVDSQDQKYILKILQNSVKNNNLKNVLGHRTDNLNRFNSTLDELYSGMNAENKTKFLKVIDRGIKKEKIDDHNLKDLYGGNKVSDDIKKLEQIESLKKDNKFEEAALISEEIGDYTGSLELYNSHHKNLASKENKQVSEISNSFGNQRRVALKKTLDNTRASFEKSLKSDTNRALLSYFADKIESVADNIPILKSKDIGQIKASREASLKSINQQSKKVYSDSEKAEMANKFESKIDDLTGSKAHTGNKIKMLLDGEQAHSRLMDRIDGSKESIFIEVFLFHDDKKGHEVADALIKKASEGVEVRVAIDGFSNKAHKGILDKLKAANNNQDVNLKFATYGGKFGAFKEPIKNRGMTAYHRKMYIFDQKHAMTGGINLGDHYLEKGQWHDMLVEVEGPILSDTLNDFYHKWSFSTGDNIEVAPPPSSFKVNEPSKSDLPFDVSDSKIRLLTTDPLNDKKDIKTWMLEAIDSAHTRIKIEDPYFNDPEIIEALIKARQRGIEVEVILPGANDVFIMKHLGNSTMEKLYSAGVDVYFYDTSGKTGFNHLKATVIDDMVSVGSSNKDVRALNTNQEINYVISDKEFTENFVKNVFDKDKQNSSEASPVIDDFLSNLTKNLMDKFPSLF